MLSEGEPTPVVFPHLAQGASTTLGHFYAIEVNQGHSIFSPSFPWQQ